MNAKEILALGKFQPGDLVVSTSESNRKIDFEIENKIDTIWEIEKRKADQEGKICYNGVSYRLNSLKIEKDKIFIDLGTIEFKTRRGLKMVPKYFSLPEEYYQKGCYSVATVKTSNEMYLMVELSGKSMNDNAIDLVGGIMEKPIEMRTGEDIFNSLYSELEEESCIRKSDVKELFLRAVYLGTNTNVGFYFETSLNISSENLVSRFKKENKDQDIKSLKIFSRSEYLSALNNHISNNKQLIVELITI